MSRQVQGVATYLPLIQISLKKFKRTKGRCAPQEDSKLYNQVAVNPQGIQMNCAYSKNLLCCLPENEHSNFGTTEKSISMITKYGFYREATRLPLSPDISNNLNKIPSPEGMLTLTQHICRSLYRQQKPLVTKLCGSKFFLFTVTCLPLSRTLRTKK